MRSWYNNLKERSIKRFSDLCANLMACFNIRILTKKSSKKLFGVIKQEGESTQAYLKRFNKEMLKMKELLKPISLKALIREVRKYAPWRRFYTLP
jgi:hypothetical protein